MSPRRAVTHLLVAGIALLPTAGCVPSNPAEPDWRARAVQAMEDVASAEASAALTLRLESDDRLLPRYAVVVLVHTEETAAMATQTLTALQPPTTVLDTAGRVAELLQSAADRITAARIALVSGSPATDLLQEALARDATRLGRLATGLETSRWPR